MIGLGQLDIEVAIDKLAGFEVADAVAGFLVDQGVKGCPGSAVSCPLSRWLERETGLHVAVFERVIRARDPLGAVGAWEWNPEDDRWAEQWEFATTPGVQAFVERFDEGWYPRLLDEAEKNPHRCAHGMGW